MFNYKIIWPIITLAAKARTAVRFHPGEMLLNTLDKDYKTDGLIEMDWVEVYLLETSDHYGLKDLDRFGHDNVKGSFGALTFMRKILTTWYFAKEDTLRESKVFFIHVRGKTYFDSSITLVLKNLNNPRQNNASVGSRDPALEVQVLEHLASSEIPLMASEAGRILGLGNLVWKLKVSCK